MNELITRWDGADRAYARGQQAYLEFGQEIARIDATQEEVAARYEMSQSSVAQLLKTVRDQRVIALTIEDRPKSMRVLYEMTTLDDDGFEELAHSGTTLQVIGDYKRRLKAPVLPPTEFKDVGDAFGASIEPAEIARPPQPSTKHFWDPFTKEWYVPDPTEKPIKAAPTISTSEALKILGIYPLKKATLQAVYNALDKSEQTKQAYEHLQKIINT